MVKKRVAQTIMIVLIATSSLFAASKQTSNPQDQKTLWQWIKGRPQQNSLYLGMVTLHFNPNSTRSDNWNNELIGGTYKGIFLGTLLNSFDDRAYVFGLSRDVYGKKISDNVHMTTGYRVGLITGYNTDIGAFAKNLPALPLLQAYLDFTYRKHIGVEFSYVGVVVSAAFYIRF